MQIAMVDENSPKWTVGEKLLFLMCLVVEINICQQFIQVIPRNKLLPIFLKPYSIHDPLLCSFYQFSDFQAWNPFLHALWNPLVMIINEVVPFLGHKLPSPFCKMNVDISIQITANSNLKPLIHGIDRLKTLNIAMQVELCGFSQFGNFTFSRNSRSDE